MRHNFVVSFGRTGDDLHADGFPEPDESCDLSIYGVVERGDNAGGCFKQIGAGVRHASALRPGHGVRADEVDTSAPRTAANQALGAANVGDQRT
jgi:hypothetical protein